MEPQELRAIVIERRKKLGLTQTELAQRAEVSLGTVQNIEAGKTKTHRTKREAVLGALGVATQADGSVDDSNDAILRAWPTDVSVFLDVLGAYLTRFDEPVRLQVIHKLTRQIFLEGPHEEM